MITSSGAIVSTMAIALLVSGCSSDTPATETNESPYASQTTAATTAPPTGRLMFSRFDESTHTFVSTHLAQPDGTGEVELVLPGPEGGGRWSRSGSEIAVMTIRSDGRVGTAVIRPDGTVARELTIPDPTLNLVCDVWSPDDSRLACEGWDDTDESRRGIYTVSAVDGSNLQQIIETPEGLNDVPGDYSPDGSQFVFLRTQGEQAGTLMVTDPGGGASRELSTDTFEDPGRFSPDGSAVVSASGGAIVILGLDGQVIERVSENGASLFGAVWSPDGEQIAYSRGVGGPFADIYVSRADGSEARQVTDTPENEIQIDWGADSDG